MLENLIGKGLYAEIKAKQNFITEIRLRLNKKISVKSRDKIIFLEDLATKSLIERVVMVATDYSYYAHQEEISRGYLTYKDGIRIGISGFGVANDKKIEFIKDITSLNIRIPNDIFNCSEPLKNIHNNFENTLVISPPFCGKTTLIRDLTRKLSEHYEVAVIDERMELGGFNGEDYCYNLGDRTDIISNIPKNLAYANILRALSPEIIVCDELSLEYDLAMIKVLAQSGVKILASLHCENEGEFMRKHKDIVEYFRYLVTLTNKPKLGIIQSFIRLNV